METTQLEHAETAKIKRMPKYHKYRVQQTIVKAFEVETFSEEEAVEAFEAALDEDAIELKKTQLSVTNLDV